MKNTILISITFLCLLWTVKASAEIKLLPHRVIDGRTMTVVDMEGLVARCSLADVVAFGENHDDPATHIVELAILEGIYRYNPQVILSLEMFERDVQPLLDSFLAGDNSEDEFLAKSRPWGNYPTDYRPMVQFAFDNGLPVVASNIPRYLAARVASGGFENAEFSDEELGWMGSTFETPRDAYWDAFSATMQMPGMGAMNVSEEQIWQIYEAQVVKDEAMAEAVTMAYMNNPGYLVYHVAGAFHLMDYLGTYSRIRRNIPGLDTVLVLALPVDDLLTGIPEDAPKADYYVLVLAPENEEMEPVEEMPVMPLPIPASE